MVNQLLLLWLYQTAFLSATVLAQVAAPLRFVTISRALGCPVALYFHSSSTREAYLSPAFCAAESELTKQCPQTDHVSNATYLNVNVTITDSNLLEAARTILKPVLGRRKLEFLRPLSVLQLLEGWELPLKLLRLPEKESAIVRVPCRTLNCSDIQSELASGVLATLDRTELKVELSVQGSVPFNLQGRISLSNHSRPLTPMYSKFVLPAPRSSNLRYYMTVAVDESCSANVLQRTDFPKHFFIEPLLCYYGFYTGDFGEGGGLVRATLVAKSDRARGRVMQELRNISPASVTFMTIFEAELQVSKWMSQWSFESLRLAPDHSKVDIGVRCNSGACCRQLISLLQNSTGNLWQHLSFSVKSQIESLETWQHRSTALVPRIDSNTCTAASRTGNVDFSILTGYKAINGSLCIRSDFVKQFPLLTDTKACADQCNRTAKCQAFSTAGSVCQLFVFDRCSKEVRDCNCNRRGGVFVKRQPGLEPGTLCPPGYGDDLCGVKYRVYGGFGNWKSGRSKCESDSGLVIMADVVDVPEISHIRSVYKKQSISSVWLGGYQTPGSAEPAGGWHWIGCNTPVNASLWHTTEPNNNGNENAIELGLWYPMLNDSSENVTNIAGTLCKCVSPFN